MKDLPAAKCKYFHLSLDRTSMETASDAANNFKNFPTIDSAFGYDFTILPNLVPTDALERVKNRKKNARKSADAVFEFASF